MNRTILIIVLIVGGSIGVWKAVQERCAQTHPSLATTEQFISYACDQAVADAAKHDHITLDYSIGSLKQVDAILGRVHENYLKNPSSIHVRGLSAEYGAYVGEVIRRNEGNAYWARDSDVAGRSLIRCTGTRASRIHLRGAHGASPTATVTASGSSTRF